MKTFAVTAELVAEFEIEAKDETDAEDKFYELYNKGFIFIDAYPFMFTDLTAVETKIREKL